MSNKAKVSNSYSIFNALKLLFFTNEQTAVNAEEAILQEDGMSDADKKILIKALKKCEGKGEKINNMGKNIVPKVQGANVNKAKGTKKQQVVKEQKEQEF